MKILVTGGNGFIGSHLVEELENQGHEVVSFDRVSPKYNDVRTIIGDITNEKEVEEAVAGSDFVFHLAGLLGTHELVGKSVDAVKVNIIGTLNVLEACKKFGAKLVEISKPNCWMNTYTITKIAAESFTNMYRKEFGVQSVIVKWFNVYGGRQPLEEEIGYKKFIPTAIVEALRGKSIEIYGNGDQTMDLVHIIDTVEAVVSILNNWDKCEGKIFEIGSGEETSVNDAAEMIRKTVNPGISIKHIPMRRGEAENTRLVAKVDELTNLTGWKPRISLEDGLRETVEWYRKKYGKQ